MADAAREFARDEDKNAAAIFAAPSQERAPDVAPTIATGRILPSLVESRSLSSADDESNLPSRPGGAEGESSKQEKGARKISRRRRRTPQDHDAIASSMTDASAAVGGPLEARASDEPPLAESVQVDKPAKAPRRAATRMSKRRVKHIEDQAILPTIPVPAVPEAPQESRSPPDDGGSRARRRSVLARYVFGTEPKLGERWKRRFRKPR